MKKYLMLGILGLCSLLTTSSGARAQLSDTALTKERAKELIEASDNYKPRKWPIPLAKTELDTCIAQGYLRWDTVGPTGKASTVLTVTDKGKQFFESASGGKTFGSKQPEPSFAVVASPIKPQVIEVTNITEGDGGTKQVEYQWNWDGKSQPQEVQRLLFTNQPGNHGKVTIKTDASDWKIVKFE